MREIVVGSSEWYDLPHHGPWLHELAERCECGAWRWQWSESDAGHDTSARHVAGLLRNLDDERWEGAFDALENGLGWAASEGMSSHRWYGSDDELLALLREAVRIARLVRRTDA